MKPTAKAYLLREGGRIASDFIRVVVARPRKSPAVTRLKQSPVQGQMESGEQEITKGLTAEKSFDKPIVAKPGTGCRSCTADHLATCAGALGEALRFARSEGMQSSEVQERIALCIQELNIWERWDATPKSFVELPEEDKVFLRHWLPKGRGLRHKLNAIENMENLEETAALAQRLYLEARKELRPKAQLNLDEAKKLAADEAAKEIERRWHSQETK